MSGLAVLREYKAHPSPRSLKKSVEYYTMRVLGPLIILLCTIVYVGYLVFWIGYLFFRSGGPLRLLGLFYILIGLFFLFIELFTLAKTIFGDIGTLESVLQDQEMRDRIDSEVLIGLPLCNKCHLPKPERCHHCSVCNKCNLRLDHHCPAVGICITVRNQQPFLCVLAWGMRSLGFVFLTALVKVFIKTQTPIEYALDGFVGVSALVLSVMLWFLFRDQITGIELNYTTFESTFGLPVNFDKGLTANRIEIFGRANESFWWPKKSNLTGFEWCTNRNRFNHVE